LKRKIQLNLARIVVLSITITSIITLLGCGEPASSLPTPLTSTTAISLSIATTPVTPTVNTSSSSSDPPETGIQATPVNGLSLIVTQPQDNYVTNANIIEVMGRSNPDAVISVNDDVTTADDQGNFAINVPLTEGPNTIDIVTSDDAGNQTGVTLVVTYQTGGQ